MNNAGGAVDRKWYVLQSKPRKEFALFDQVLARRIECYFPQVQVVPVNPRSAKVRPFFPGYMFVFVDLNVVGLSALQWLPFARGLVGFDGEPAVAPDGLVSALKERIARINARGGLQLDGLEAGQKVRVTEGPFKGYEGVFDTKLDDAGRVRVLLTLLKERQLRVTLSAAQITPIQVRN